VVRFDYAQIKWGFGCDLYDAELPFPKFIYPAILYSIYVAGDELFELGPEDAQASELYPDYEYKTVSSLLDKFV
jgi:hypothetical protein